jgi:hypothetical protein
MEFYAYGIPILLFSLWILAVLCEILLKAVVRVIDAVLGLLAFLLL